MRNGIRSENGFDSKDDYKSTQVLGLSTSKLEKCYFRTVVDLFEQFPLTTYLPNSDIGVKSYGQNTEIVQS